jgi:hypothetical protein
MTSHVQPPRSSSPSRGAPPAVSSGLELAPHVRNRPRPRTAEFDLNDLGVLKPVSITPMPARERTRTRDIHIVEERDATVAGVLSGLVMLGFLAEPLVARALERTTDIPLVGGLVLGLVSFALYFVVGQFVRNGAIGVVVLAMTWVLAIVTLNAVERDNIGAILAAAAWMWAPLAFIVGMGAQALTHSWPRVFSWRGVLACAVVSVASTIAFG